MARTSDLLPRGYLGTLGKSFVPSMEPTSGTLHRSVRSRSHVRCEWLLSAVRLDITASKNHQHAVNNPYAQFRDGWTEEQVLNSPKVTEPLTKLMCTPTTVRRPILRLSVRKI